MEKNLKTYGLVWLFANLEIEIYFCSRICLILVLALSWDEIIITNWLVNNEYDLYDNNFLFNHYFTIWGWDIFFILLR